MTSVEYFPPCRKIGKQILTVSGPFGETLIFLPPEQGQVDHPTLSDPLPLSFVSNEPLPISRPKMVSAS